MSLHSLSLDLRQLKIDVSQAKASPLNSVDGGKKGSIVGNMLARKRKTLENQWINKGFGTRGGNR